MLGSIHDPLAAAMQLQGKVLPQLCRGFHCVSCHMQRRHPILMRVEAKFISFPHSRLSNSFIFCRADLCDIPKVPPLQTTHEVPQLPSSL